MEMISLSFKNETNEYVTLLVVVSVIGGIFVS